MEYSEAEIKIGQLELKYEELEQKLENIQKQIHSQMENSSNDEDSCDLESETKYNSNNEMIINTNLLQSIRIDSLKARVTNLEQNMIYTILWGCALTTIIISKLHTLCVLSK
jgi:hypothetical protein